MMKMKKKIEMSSHETKRGVTEIEYFNDIILNVYLILFENYEIII